MYYFRLRLLSSNRLYKVKPRDVTTDAHWESTMTFNSEFSPLELRQQLLLYGCVTEISATSRRSSKHPETLSCVFVLL